MVSIMMSKSNLKHFAVMMLMLFYPLQILMADPSILIIDDRSSADFKALSGDEWLLRTDGVMGGVSEGQLSLDEIAGRRCVRMRGEVKLDNNGGFVQSTLNLSNQTTQNIEAYSGLMLEVYGNNEEYNMHLRTSDIWLPWQSYRASFTAPPEWKTIYIPFSQFKPYRIRKALNIKNLKRIGIVAIGREFNADLCIGKIGLYKDQNTPSNNY